MTQSIALGDIIYPAVYPAAAKQEQDNSQQPMQHVIVFTSFIQASLVLMVEQG
jgi:hypothetical protein